MIIQLLQQLHPFACGYSSLFVQNNTSIFKLFFHTTKKAFLLIAIASNRRFATRLRIPICPVKNSSLSVADQFEDMTRWEIPTAYN